MLEHQIAGRLAALGKVAACAATGHLGVAMFPAVAFTAGWAADQLGDGHPFGRAAAGVLNNVFGNLSTSAAQSVVSALREDTNHDLEKALAAAIRAALSRAYEDLAATSDRDTFKPLFELWLTRIDRGLTSPLEIDLLFRTSDSIDPVQVAGISDYEYWALLRATLLRWADEQAQYDRKDTRIIRSERLTELPAPLESYLSANLPDFCRKAMKMVLRQPAHLQGWISWQQRFLEAIARETTAVDPAIARRLHDLAGRADDLQVFLVDKLNDMHGDLRELKTDVKHVKRLLGNHPENHGVSVFATVPPLSPNVARHPELLSRLRDLVLGDDGAPNLIAIRGRGSISESELVLQLCYDDRIRARFADGIVWLAMGRQSMGDVLSRIKFVTEAINQDPSVYTQDNWYWRYRDCLANKAVLIILDGAPDLETVQAFQTDSTRCRVIFATRDRGIAARLSAKVFDAGELDGKRGLAMRTGGYPYVYGEFQVSDGRIFFGREADIKQILDRIEEYPELRMVAIQGPSGVGKSSLLQAGLIYRLTQKQKRTRGKSWVFCLFNPFDPDLTPFGAMAHNLPKEHGRFDNPALIAKRIYEACRENPATVAAVLEETLLRGLDSHVHLILAVNQLEELWTMAQEEFAAPFLTFLAAAATNPRILVLVTVRDDFSTHFKNAPQVSPLFQAMTAWEYPLRAPLRTEIEDIVRKPAKRVSPPITFDDESKFVESIASDARDLGETALPLFSLMLQSLRQPDPKGEQVGHFTMADYQKLGGLNGIVRTLAHRAGAEQNSELLDQLFRNLVAVGDSSLDRRPILREARSADIIDAAGEGQSLAMRNLIENLAGARLLYKHEGLIRIAYESLIEHWDELRSWWERNAWDLAILEELRRDAMLWHRRRERTAYLKTLSERLDEAEKIADRYADPNTRDEDRTLQRYLRACRVRSLRDQLIQCVKGGHVTFAVAVLRKLRKLGVEARLEDEDRGTDAHQLKRAFWAAITGDDKPRELEEGWQVDGASIFDGDDGRFEMLRTTSRGITPLAWAAVAGQVDLVRRLLAKGDRSWERLQEDDGTIVETASVGGSREAISLLVEQAERANVNLFRPDRIGNSPMLWAIQEGHNKLVDYYLEKGQNLEVKAIEEFDALTEAARGDNLPIARKLIENLKWDPNRRTKGQEWTALHFACLGQKSEEATVARALVREYGADVHARAREGQTPLHIAAQEGKLAAIDVLVSVARERGELNELLEAKNSNGFTPLQEACFFDKSSVVQRLIIEGANTNARDNDGDTSLCVAVERGNYRSVQLLLDAGANTELFSPKRWPALCFAADDGDLEMVETLLRAKGINPNVLVSPDWTPMMVASKKGHSEIVKALLKTGANPCFVNSRGQSVVSIAYKEGDKKTINLLKTWAKQNEDLAKLLKHQEELEYNRARLESWQLSAPLSQPVSEPDDLTETIDLLREHVSKWGSEVEAASALGWTRTVRGLMANGAPQPISWTRPRVSDAAWFLSFTEIKPAAESTLASTLGILQPYLAGRPEYRRLRAALLSFFPKYTLIAVEDTDTPGQNEQFLLQGPKSTILMNWRNEGIYTVAEDCSPAFDDDQDAIAYCRFFFHWVRGDLGRFNIVERADQIQWSAAPEDDLLVKVAEHLRPLRVVERTDDYVRLTGSIVFKNALFQSDIVVAIRTTEILDSETEQNERLTVGQTRLLNEKLLLEDLPFVIDGPPGVFG